MFSTVNILEMVRQIDETVRFHIIIQWTILGVVGAILFAALAYYVKQRVISGIEGGIENVKKDYEKRFSDLQNNNNVNKDKLNRLTKEFEDALNDIESNNETGSFFIKVHQNNTIISNSKQYYYKINNLMIIDIDIIFRNFDSTDQSVFLEGLPVIPLKDTCEILSITNAINNNNGIISIEGMLSQFNHRIELFVNKQGETTDNLRFSDIDSNTRISGKIIYEIM